MSFVAMVHRSLWTFGIIFNICLILLSSIESVHAFNNSIQLSRDFHSDIEMYNNSEKVERHIFDYRKNGIRLDIRLVSGVNNSNNEEEDDDFPMPPMKDIGRCVIDLSTICVKNKIARYIDTVGRLDRITLFGSTIKFVKVREPPKKVFRHRAMNSVDNIDRSIDEFFDKFALRITLPGWNKRKEQNQIDFMFDDTDLVEGRGKGGGGGGKGGKGGGKCKQMMMCMMMALKMKMAGMMGLMMVKGMMMAGISMMMTKAMLLMKLMKLKGGGGGGGGGGGDNGGQLKEIVLLTKASSGGGGGGGGGNYGPPPSPPSSYGAPPSSAGSGGYSGGVGGGWGRSFDNRLPMKSIFETYSQIDSMQQSGDNFSIINGHPGLNRNNYLRSIDNYRNIGEVLDNSELDNDGNNLQIKSKIGDKPINVENKLENDHENTNIVYANYWKNYEAADKIWDAKGPIVATKISSTEKLT